MKKWSRFKTNTKYQTASVLVELKYNTVNSKKQKNVRVVMML